LCDLVHRELGDDPRIVVEDHYQYLFSFSQHGQALWRAHSCVVYIVTMSLEAIQEAISKLTDDERSSLASWLTLQTMDDWDKEMQRDFSSGGRGQHLAAKVKAEIRAGRCRPMRDERPQTSDDSVEGT